MKMWTLKNSKGVVCVFKEPYDFKEVNGVIKNDLIKNPDYYDSNEPDWQGEKSIIILGSTRYGNKGDETKLATYQFVPS